MVKTERPKTYTDRTLTHVPLSLIRQHEDIPYRPIDKEWVAQLRKMIETQGLEAPLTLWNGDEEGTKGIQIELEGKEGKYPAAFLIAGAHRRQALRDFAKQNPNGFKEAFPNGVPAYIKSGSLQEVLATMLRENVARKEMDIIQILPVVEKLIELGLKQKQIANQIGKSEGFISQVLSAKEELGDEETEDLANSGASITELRKAAKEVKDKSKGKSSGDKKKIAKEVVAKTKAKVQQKKASGKKRDDKRVSAKTLFKRYHSLPRTTKVGAKVDMLESVLGYLAGEENFDLPKELLNDAESASDEK